MLALFASTCHPAIASSPRPAARGGHHHHRGRCRARHRRPHLDLTMLLGAGMDPHTFEPAPRDAATVADGPGAVPQRRRIGNIPGPLLEANRNRDTLVVDLCEGLPLVHRETACPEHDHEEHAHHEDGELDPHVWLDPRLVAAWADTIGRVLGERDPERAAHYQERAAAYRRQLAELDRLDSRTGGHPAGAPAALSSRTITNSATSPIATGSPSPAPCCPT
jgi:hypothetical protein